MFGMLDLVYPQCHPQEITNLGSGRNIGSADLAYHRLDSSVAKCCVRIVTVLLLLC